jgi:hypothetical protein
MTSSRAFLHLGQIKSPPTPGADAQAVLVVCALKLVADDQRSASRAMITNFTVIVSGTPRNLRRDSRVLSPAWIRGVRYKVEVCNSLLFPRESQGFNLSPSISMAKEKGLVGLLRNGPYLLDRGLPTLLALELFACGVELPRPLCCIFIGALLAQE